ncbi:hypothetical protein Adt_35301 [Abeliophyllum distichum]|uniref:Uncharacterized protein n=1 Tax=Abeliophyllum distichum TaxID=126358 RepID=A0ABD1QEB6_9LAMI
MLTKRLDDALNAQHVTFSTLERTNEEKKKLLEEASSSQSELVELDAEVASAKLLVENESLEEKLENTKTEFIANFHNTDAYSNFSNYLASVGQQNFLNAI